MSRPMSMIRAYLAWLRAVLAERSYLIRPYDMLADRRRWCWQRRTPCGLGALAPERAATILRAWQDR